MALAIFAVALAIRVWHVWQIRASPFFSVLLGDARGYDEWAQRIAAGDWVGSEVFYQAPLYPYFLGAIYASVGRDLLIVRICQALLGSTACVLLGLTARRLFSPRAGAIAGFAMAMYAPAVFFDGLVQKSVLDVFFVCLALYVMSGIVASGAQEPIPSRRRRWVTLGVCMGALSLTRENALVLVAVILVWAIARPKGAARGTVARGVAASVAFGLGLAVVLLPVVTRNYAVGGGFYLTTSQFGPNFYIGNNPESDGTYASLRPGRGAPEYERRDATDLAEHAVGRRLSPAEVSGYWTDRALDFITTQPGAWLRLVGRKILLLANADEMLDTESQETYAEWSVPLRTLSRIGHFGVLVPLALLGMWVVWPDRRQLWVFYAMAAAYAASVVMFYVFARYRFPLVPLLVLFAAAGLSSAFKLVRYRSQLFFTGAGAPRLPIAAGTPPPPLSLGAVAPRDGSRLPARTDADPSPRISSSSARDGRRRFKYSFSSLAVTTSLVACTAAVNWPMLSTSRMRAITETNLAAALQEAGRLDEAEGRYRRAVEIEPTYAPAYNNLGTALRASGQIDEAVASYRRALEVLGVYPDAHYNLANALLEQGKPVEAAEHFRIALRSIPGEARVHNNLGIAMADAGKLDEAIAAFELALKADPTSAVALRNLGSALASRGRVEEGVGYLVRAAELAPDNADAHYDLGSVWLERGELTRAAAAFGRALEIRPDHAPSHNNLGIALASQDRVDEAVGHFEQALKIEPGFRDAERNLAMIRKAGKRR